MVGLHRQRIVRLRHVALILFVAMGVIGGAWLFAAGRHDPDTGPLEEWLKSVSAEVRRESTYPEWIRRCLPSNAGTHIVSVGIWDCKLDRKDIAHLARLPHLRCLILVRCELPEDALREMHQIRTLEDLHLAESNIDDDKLRIVCQNGKLKILDLSMTKITDRAIPYLLQLRELRILMFLGPTKITAEGLQQLRAMRDLLLLRLDSSSIPEKEIAVLRKVLPGVEIVGHGGWNVTDADEKKYSGLRYLLDSE